MRGGSLLVTTCVVLAVSLSLFDQIMSGQSLLGQISSGQISRPDSVQESATQDDSRRPFPTSITEGSHIGVSLPHPLPGAPGTTFFRQLTQSAGIIFSGKVTSIARTPASGSQPQTLAIAFHVEHAIRGVSAGRDFTIFQWIGLWNNGQRYQIGERVLLFLYPPSKLGLTSCVGGPLGRFSVDANDGVVFSELHRAALRTDPILRWRSKLSVHDLHQAVRRASGEE